jgi:16S rRNA (uracil1498-N3)-methyltransferase
MKTGNEERMPVRPRFHIAPQAVQLAAGACFDLPADAARHVQVLRLQPGDFIHLFDGAGYEWRARVQEMGRKHVGVEVDQAVAPCAGELPVAVTLAMGVPANDRMDALVEKACELGVTRIQPLMCERSVLRLDGERAAKKVAHWQAVAVSACEQSGRATVPEISPVLALPVWLKDSAQTSGSGFTRVAGSNDGDDAWPVHRAVLSLREAVSMRRWLASMGLRAQLEAVGGAQANMPRMAELVFLSGPEGGLSESEETAALQAGWSAVSLGGRVLRADTAPLAALSVIGCELEG